MIVKAEGKLVVTGPGETILWSTEGPGIGTISFSHVFLKVQNDGNLVLYNPFFDNLAEERPIWDSRTQGKDTKPVLVMQNDGNLVLCGGRFGR